MAGFQQARKGVRLFLFIENWSRKEVSVNTRAIRTSTVSLTATAGKYLIRFNGELVNPSTQEEIGNIQRTIRREVRTRWQQNRDPQDLQQYLWMIFAPSTSSSHYRIFRRLEIFVDNSNPVGKTNTRRRRKSKSLRKHRNV